MASVATSYAPAEFGNLDDMQEEEEDDLDANNAEAILEAVNTHDYQKFQHEFDIARAAGADAVLFELVNIFDIDGNTLLHRCALGQAVSSSTSDSEGGGERIAEFLLTSKAAVNSVNLLDSLAGETALMEAACSGNADLCRLLLESRADPLQPNRDGFTARDLLSMEGGGDDAIMELLGGVVGDNEEVEVDVDGGHVDEEGNGGAAGLGEADFADEEEVVETDGKDAAVGVGEDASHVADAAGGEATAAAPQPAASRKPLSLRAAVKAHDVDSVSAALVSLGDNAGAALDATDVKGRTLLHICAASPGRESSAEIARLLLEGNARLEAQDAAGQVPLALAVAEGLGEQEEVGRWAVLDVVRVLLVAKADPAGIDEWRLPDSPLQAASSSPTGMEICKLLQAFGTELPWFASGPASPSEAEGEEPGPAPTQSLCSQCEERGILYDKLGESAAANLLQEHDEWQSMSGKALRSKCEADQVPIEDCIEKGDFVRRLLEVRTWQVMPYESLKAVFKALDASLAASLEGASREDLEDALMISKWGVPMGKRAPSPQEEDHDSDALREKCIEKGIPFEILESEKQAMDLLRKIELLEKNSISDLKKEYKQMSLTLEAGMEKRDMVSRLMDVHVWEAIPIFELQKVCAQRGVQSGTETNRKNLIQRLLGASQVSQQPRRTFLYQAPPGQSGESAEGAKPSAKPSAKAPGSTAPGSSGGGDAFRANLEKAGVKQKPRTQAWEVPFYGKSPPKAKSGPQPKSGPEPKSSAPPRKAGVPSLAQDYVTLGLDKNANQNDVRKAYRKLALQYHPDKNPGKLQEEASRKFRLVQEAYTRICEHLKPKGK